MNSMKYRGYAARIEFDERDDVLVGRVIGTRDAICFHADNVADLKREFRASIDDYLNYCARQAGKRKANAAHTSRSSRCVTYCCADCRGKP